MLGSEPNKPMAMRADGGEGEARRGLTCYTAPGERFDCEEAMKAHYRSDFHRHNLKRKVAGLAPLTRAAYEAREAREAERPEEGAHRRTTADRRKAREEKRQQKVAAQAKNPNSKAAHFEAVQRMTADEYVEHKMLAAPDFDEASDIFSRHQSSDLHANLAHMAKTHGFYVPHIEYCSDLAGLIGYLQEKVYVGNVALRTGKQFHSVEAVQAHMRAKGQCSFELEGHEDEFAAFYDMEALAAGSPLWEVMSDEDEEGEEDEEGWEDEEDEEEDEEEEGSRLQEFDALFERAVELHVLSEAQVDTLTDAIAAGEVTEGVLVRRYRRLVLRAEAAAAAGEELPDDMSTTTSTARRVRYNPMPASAEAASLMLANREVGHRQLARFYKQKFRPTGTSLVCSSPQLDTLMLQYAKAGVLSSQLQMRMSQPRAKNERGRAAMQIAAKQHVKQGTTNNTTANGMKHFKNRSLNF